MATAVKAPTYPHISERPGVRGGQPCIDGTRITVVDVAITHESGISVQDLRTHFSSRPLTLAEIHAALTYHHDHPGLVDEYRRTFKRNAEELERTKAELIARRAGR